jgi:hypothetical protein
VAVETVEQAEAPAAPVEPAPVRNDSKLPSTGRGHQDQSRPQGGHTFGQPVHNGFDMQSRSREKDLQSQPARVCI